MAPKKQATAGTPPSATTPVKPSAASHSAPPTTSAASSALRSSKTTTSNANATTIDEAQQIVNNLWNNYLETTPQRTKLLDVFLGFLLVVGVLQFAYCVIGGNYPFNAFLAGFSATVGQFVLTASLRMQTNAGNKSEFQGLSHERAFADFVFGSMILHFFCVNFIN